MLGLEKVVAVKWSSAPAQNSCALRQKNQSMPLLHIALNVLDKAGNSFALPSPVLDVVKLAIRNSILSDSFTWVPKP